jgi:hypothetical protein
MGAPGLDFETWDPPGKGSFRPVLCPQVNQQALVAYPISLLVKANFVKDNFDPCYSPR